MSTKKSIPPAGSAPRTGPVEGWLYFCCFMIFAMAVIGAITRLTESGLSMVEWRPVTGWLPPLSEAEWNRVYSLYQESPEFRHKHHWMAVDDFKRIFFWEWLHRLWGRLIGLAYAVPLLWFVARRQIPAGYGWKFAFLLALGGLQGVAGWWMVASGLIDRPSVSHYRLAVHLGLAFILFAAVWWLALDLRRARRNAADAANGPCRAASFCQKRHAVIALALMSLTIIWGAFVAGLDAGLVYNSFPLMGGQFTPPETFHAGSILNDHGWVQFTHRWLAVTAGIVTLWLAIRVTDFTLGAMVLVQIGLGIATLLTQVWLPLAALHQAGAIALLALLLYRLHAMKGTPAATKTEKAKEAEEAAKITGGTV